MIEKQVRAGGCFGEGSLLCWGMTRILTLRNLFAATLLLLVTSAWAKPFTVVVYNVENLFDASGHSLYDDYKPANYTPAHVLTKVQNVSRVLAQFEGGKGPDIILFQEIGAHLPAPARPINFETVLKKYAGTKIEAMLGADFSPAIAALPSEALLAKAMADRGLEGYHIVPAENIKSADSVNPLAQKCVVFTRFPVKHAISHPTLDARAILEVQVLVDGAVLYLFNNHWKSGAGDPVTEKTRVENARTLRTRLDEILKDDPNADIILGGDFNSQYNQKRVYPKMKLTGLNDVLGSQGNALAVRGGTRDLYNLWFDLPNNLRGSDTYRGEWGTLMQVILSRGLFDFRGVQYVDKSFGVAKFAGVNEDITGLPVRWSFENSGSGFSDHFPLYARFTTVKDNRADRWLPVRSTEAEVEPAEANKVDFSHLDLPRLAMNMEDLPPQTKLRDGSHNGKIFHVEGPVGPSERLTVTFRGESYDVYAPDPALRDRLRAKHKAGDTIRFYAQLGRYRDRWQFVVQDPSWVK